MTNEIKSCLIDTSLPIVYWPFAVFHVLQIQNALLDNAQGSSPIHLLTGKKRNLKILHTFRCQVCFHPPSIQAKRFKEKGCKGIFLGYVPHATQHNILYDVES